MPKRKLGRVVTIIQARMGSSRFPNKMMSELNGKPLIEWVVRRSQKAENVDCTVLATSKKEQDDILASMADKYDCPTFRGSESDVLGRYSSAADEFGADTVVRICADRPLVDPQLIDSSLDRYSVVDADLVYNHISGDEQYWPRGFGAEVFSAEILHWMDKNVASSFCREHVTPHIWDDKSGFTVDPVECPSNINPGIKDLKLDVDTVEDLDRLKVVCADMGINAHTSEIIQSWKVLSANGVV